MIMQYYADKRYKGSITRESKYVKSNGKRERKKIAASLPFIQMITHGMIDSIPSVNVFLFIQN